MRRLTKLWTRWHRTGLFSLTCTLSYDQRKSSQGRSVFDSYWANGAESPIAHGTIGGLGRQTDVISAASGKMFRAFLDESYNNEVFIISGFAADVSIWPSIDAQWKRAIKRKGLNRYHAVDCFHGKEEFRNWPREAREGLTAELSRILVNRRPGSSQLREGIYGVTYATDRRAYRDLMSSSPYPDEYMLLLQLMIRKLAVLCQALPPAERIDVVMDRNTRFTGKAIELFKRLAQDPRVEHRQRLGAISTRDYPDRNLKLGNH